MGETQSQSQDRLAFIAVTAFVIAMFTVPGERIDFTRPLRLAKVTSGASALFLLVGRIGRGRAISFDGIRGGSLLALFILSAASISWSVNAEASKAMSATW